MFHQSPSPIPPSDSFGVVRVSSLAAALVKLDVDITIEDLLKAVRDAEDEAGHLKFSAAVRAEDEETRKERRAALSALALQANQPSTGLEFTTVSRFVTKPPKPAHVDPLANARRRRLLELTEEAFPGGKVPDPLAY